jgi:hypothetical protein
LFYLLVVIVPERLLHLGGRVEDRVRWDVQVGR